MVPHKCWVGGKDPFPSPAGSTHSNTAQDSTSLLCSKDTLLVHVQLGCPPGTPGHFLPICFPAAWPAACPGAWGFAQAQDLVLPLLELHEVLSSRKVITTNSCSWNSSKKRGVPSEELTINCSCKRKYLTCKVLFPLIKWIMEILYLYYQISCQSSVLLSRQHVKYPCKKTWNISTSIGRTHTWIEML